MSEQTQAISIQPKPRTAASTQPAPLLTRRDHVQNRQTPKLSFQILCQPNLRRLQGNLPTFP